MKKMILGLLIGLIMGLAATALAFDRDGGWVNYNVHVTEWTDPDTHLQYLVVESEGVQGNYIAVTPRYTPSGNIRYVGNGND